MPTKTYPQLDAQTGVDDADLLASFRALGPLKKITAATLRTYFQTAVPGADVTFIRLGADAILRSALAKERDIQNVLDTDGVDNTGADECAAAIQTAIDVALAAGQQLVGYGTFKIGSKVVFKGPTDFSQATFNVINAPDVAVEVSTGNAVDPTTPLVNAVVWLPRITNTTKPATGWAGQGVGVRTVNTYSCYVFFSQITGFKRNLLCTSYGSNGNVDNKYFLGWLDNGEINLDLNPGDGSGWVNQNQFYGGRCHHNSEEGVDVVGTRHIRIAKATEPVNGNDFIGTSIEGNTAEYHVENGGAVNLLMNLRWEAATPKVLYTADNANQGAFNHIERGFGVDSIVYTYDGVTSYRNSAEGSSGSVSSVSLGHRIQNQSSSALPIFTFYEAGTVPELAGPTEWSTKFGSQLLEYKAKANAYARVQLNGATSRLYFGNGAVAATASIGAIGSADMGSFGHWFPSATNTYALGDVSLRWSNVYGTNLRPGAGTAIWTSGTGTPEGAVTAPVGSLFTRTDGGAVTTLYVKESGAGNTGWVAK